MTRPRRPLVILLLAVVACSSCFYSHQYLNQGVAKEKEGDLIAAEHFFTKALEVDTQNAQAYFNRGVASMNMREYPEAIKDFEKVIQLESGMRDKAMKRIEYCRSQIKRFE